MDNPAVNRCPMLAEMSVGEQGTVCEILGGIGPSAEIGVTYRGFSDWFNARCATTTNGDRHY
jgi:hypothetical protein